MVNFSEALARGSLCHQILPNCCALTKVQPSHFELALILIQFKLIDVCSEMFPEKVFEVENSMWFHIL